MVLSISLTWTTGFTVTFGVTVTFAAVLTVAAPSTASVALIRSITMPKMAQHLLPLSYQAHLVVTQSLLISGQSIFSHIENRLVYQNH
jgi:hypothetical protein